MGKGSIRLSAPPGLTVVEGGGVTSAVGFSASGTCAGIKKKTEKPDLALVAADEPCAAAGMFTTNVFCSAPVTVSREHLDGVSYGTARAVLINSGNANAATGQIGLDAARETARMAADELGCCAEEVLVASTGVIGVHLPMAPFKEYMPEAVRSLSYEGGARAAYAIMTTDTFPKEYAVSYLSADPALQGRRITVGGMAKGSGMIMPNMATMISVLTTDAPLSAPLAHRALQEAVNVSFNKVTVDSDTSTNDSCYLLASGRCPMGEAEGASNDASDDALDGALDGAPDGAPTSAPTSAPASAPVPTSTPAPFITDVDSLAYAEFRDALVHVCTTLARDMAFDGEGATRLVTVQVTGAANGADADAAARTIANSPLVKTAIFGHDANWGRIAGAAGRSGASFRQEDVSIDIMGIPVCRDGLTVAFDEDEALRRFEDPEIVLWVDLGAGESSATIWSCDFTHDYVTINGDYRT